MNAKREVTRGLREINQQEAIIIERIFAEFAVGQSSTQIAMGLNADGIQAPRGGQWNASYIRGDLKKATGTLNNLLYAGRLVLGPQAVAAQPRR